MMQIYYAMYVPKFYIQELKYRILLYMVLAGMLGRHI